MSIERAQFAIRVCDVDDEGAAAKLRVQTSHPIPCAVTPRHCKVETTAWRQHGGMAQEVVGPLEPYTGRRSESSQTPGCMHALNGSHALHMQSSRVERSIRRFPSVTRKSLLIGLSPGDCSSVHRQTDHGKQTVGGQANSSIMMSIQD
jgi:hypothetical protein